MNMTWLSNKIRDYSIANYTERLDKMWQDLPGIIHGDAFKFEMTRFIPMDVQQRTLAKDKFYDHLSNEIRGLLEIVRRELNNTPTENEFRI